VSWKEGEIGFLNFWYPDRRPDGQIDRLDQSEVRRELKQKAVKTVTAMNRFDVRAPVCASDMRKRNTISMKNEINHRFAIILTERPSLNPVMRNDLDIAENDIIRAYGGRLFWQRCGNRQRAARFAERKDFVRSAVFKTKEEMACNISRPEDLLQPENIGILGDAIMGISGWLAAGESLPDFPVIDEKIKPYRQAGSQIVTHPSLDLQPEISYSCGNINGEVVRNTV
jgi:hypothetical protein